MTKILLFIIGVFLWMDGVGQCSKYVKFTTDAEFHKTGVLLRKEKIPIDSKSGFELNIAGSNDGGAVDISIYGNKSCIAEYSELLIAFEDNTSITLEIHADTCDHSAMVYFSTIELASPNLSTIDKFMKFAKSKVRGISIKTVDGILKAPLTQASKDYIFNAAVCMLKD